ncbi:unnamed protein product, partial [Diplocarpon coronariae]
MKTQMLAAAVGLFSSALAAPCGGETPVVGTSSPATPSRTSAPSSSASPSSPPAAEVPTYGPTAAGDGPVGYGAATTGGAGGTTTTVSDCAALTAAVDKKNTAKKIVYIDGMLTGCGIVDVGSNTSILGRGAASGVKDTGF